MPSLKSTLAAIFAAAVTAAGVSYVLRDDDTLKAPSVVTSTKGDRERGPGRDVARDFNRYHSGTPAQIRANELKTLASERAALEAIHNFYLGSASLQNVQTSLDALRASPSSFAESKVQRIVDWLKKPETYSPEENQKAIKEIDAQIKQLTEQQRRSENTVPLSIQTAMNAMLPVASGPTTKSQPSKAAAKAPKPAK